MSAEPISREASVQTDSDADNEPAIPPAEIYETLLQTHQICPWCFRWRIRREVAAAGGIEVAGVTADVDPDDVADVESIYPPRVPRPAGDADVPLERYRACQPEQQACECGDVDADPLKTLSKDKALSLVPAIARRVGEFGYIYSLETLHERVEWGKSNPSIQGNDDLVFQVAVAAAVVDARGGDVEAVVTEVLDD
jgi:hypothetical protein